jgi:hypothetical protein
VAIRIRFVAGGGFVGDSIRWVTNSLFQHVEFGTPEGTWIGAHAGAGSRSGLRTMRSYDREFVYDVPATDSQRSAADDLGAQADRDQYNYSTFSGC